MAGNNSNIVLIYHSNCNILPTMQLIQDKYTFNPKQPLAGAY